MDCSLPGSSVHGISQACILAWVAISFSIGHLHPWIKPACPALASRFFIAESPGKLQAKITLQLFFKEVHGSTLNITRFVFKFFFPIDIKFSIISCYCKQACVLPVSSVSHLLVFTWW